MELMTKEDYSEHSERMYKQHNGITSGKYDFSPLQLDLMFMILSIIKEGQKDYLISIADMELLTGRRWNYQQFREATETLGSRMFEIENERGNYMQLWLLTSVEYIEGKGKIEITLNDKSLPLFFDLKNNFTHFQLKSVLSCSSKYAKRIYMICCQWRSVGKFPKPMAIKELKEILGIIDKKGNDTYLNQFAKFKSNVLETAKTQINQLTDIHFEYELFKRGRSFEFIQFYIGGRKQIGTQSEIDFGLDLQYQLALSYSKEIGINEEQAHLIIQSGIDEYRTIIEEVKAKRKKGEIKNPTAYIIGVYQKKGVLPIKQD